MAITNLSSLKAQKNCIRIIIPIFCRQLIWCLLRYQLVNLILPIIKDQYADFVITTSFNGVVLLCFPQF